MLISSILHIKSHLIHENNGSFLHILDIPLVPELMHIEILANSLRILRNIMFDQFPQLLDLQFIQLQLLLLLF